jgi:hypothetical protein
MMLRLQQLSVPLWCAHEGFLKVVDLRCPARCEVDITRSDGWVITRIQGDNCIAQAFQARAHLATESARQSRRVFSVDRLPAF